MRPRDVKYNKVYRGFNIHNRREVKGLDLEFGTAGSKSAVGGRITGKHSETIRKVLRKTMRKRGKIRLRVRPEKGLTKKAIAVRTGKGKGSVREWVSEVGSGRVLSEISGVRLKRGLRLLRRGRERLPIKSVVVPYRV